MTHSEVLIPNLLWGQDKEHIFATINVADLDAADVQFDEDRLTFKGSKSERSGDAKDYAMSVELASPIDVSACNWAKRARNVQIVMKKKESGDKWTQFAKDVKKWKAHIAVDWNKWVDSDDEDNVPGRFDDLSDIMAGGGAGNMDFASMMKNSGGGFAPGAADDDDDEQDSDDEELPELDSEAPAAPAPAHDHVQASEATESH